MVLLKKEKLNSNLGKILKQRRLMVKLTLHELAAKSVVSAPYIGRIEKGERFPSASVLRKMAKPLDFDEGELFTLAGYLPPQAPTTENETGIGRLDPYVARVLAQESVNVQYAVVGILSILSSLTKHIEKE